MGTHMCTVPAAVKTDYFGQAARQVDGHGQSHPYLQQLIIMPMACSMSGVPAKLAVLSLKVEL